MFRRSDHRRREPRGHRAIPDVSAQRCAAGELRDRYVITYVGGFDATRVSRPPSGPCRPSFVTCLEALLMLVGDGGIRGELEGLSRARPRGHVRFEGWVDFSRVPSYIAASDVCILPLVRSVQTDAVAAAQALPVHAHGQTRRGQRMRGDESRDRGGGLRSPLPPGDSDALAEALIRLTDPEMRTQLGEHGRQAVHDRYNWSRAASRLLGSTRVWTASAGRALGVT